MKFGPKLTKRQIWSAGKRGKEGKNSVANFRICKASPQIKIQFGRKDIRTLLLNDDFQ
jgi:hypothetical protein